MAKRSVSTMFQQPADPWIEALKQMQQGAMSTGLTPPKTSMSGLGQSSYATAALPGGNPSEGPAVPFPSSEPMPDATVPPKSRPKTEGPAVPFPSSEPMPDATVPPKPRPKTEGGLPPVRPVGGEPVIPPVSEPEDKLPPKKKGGTNPESGDPIVPPAPTPTGTPPAELSDYEKWRWMVNNWGGWDPTILQEYLASGDYDSLMKNFIASTQGYRFLSPWAINRYTNKYSAMPFLDMYIQNGIDAKPDDGGDPTRIANQIKGWIGGSDTGFSNFGNRRGMTDQLMNTLKQGNDLALQGRDNSAMSDREKDILNQWSFFTGSDAGSNLLNAFIGASIGPSPYGQFERERFIDQTDIMKTLPENAYGPGKWLGWLLRNWVGGTHRFNNPWQMSTGGGA